MSSWHDLRKLRLLYLNRFRKKSRLVLHWTPAFRIVVYRSKYSRRDAYICYLLFKVVYWANEIQTEKYQKRYS